MSAIKGSRRLSLLLYFGLALATAQSNAIESIEWKVAATPVIVVARAAADQTQLPHQTVGRFEVVERIKGLEGASSFLVRWLVEDDQPYPRWVADRTPLLLFLTPLGPNPYVPRWHTAKDWDLSAYPLDGAEEITRAYTAGLRPLTRPDDLLAAVRAAHAADFAPKPVFLPLRSTEFQAIDGAAPFSIPLDAFDGYAAAQLLGHPKHAIRALAIEAILRVELPRDRARALLAPVLANDDTAEARPGFLGHRTVYPLRERAWQVLKLLNLHTPPPRVEFPSLGWRIARILLPIVAALAGTCALHRYKRRHRPRPIISLRTRLKGLALLATYAGFALITAGWLASRSNIRLDLVTGGGYGLIVDSRQDTLDVEIDDNSSLLVSDVRLTADAEVIYSDDPTFRPGGLVFRAGQSVAPGTEIRSGTVFLHRRVRWLTLFLCFAVVIFARLLHALTLGRRHRRRARLMRQGFCPDCGYDLRGSADRCPECGRPTHPANQWIKLLHPDPPSRLDKA